MSNQMSNRFDTKFNEISSDINKRFDINDSKLNEQNNKFDVKFNEINIKVTESQKNIDDKLNLSLIHI